MGKPNNIIVVKQFLVKSRVWFSLTGAAMAVYLIFRTKCQVGKPPGKPGKRDWMILNNGQITFTYAEARTEYGLTASRFRRALDELIAKGFIDVEATGMGVQKATSLYAISERWRDYGTTAFRQAKRPKPGIANPGFRPGNKLWRLVSKKNTSVEIAHGAVHENAHGEDFAVHENAHGEKRLFLCKGRNCKDLSSEIAQITAVRDSNTVL